MDFNIAKQVIDNLLSDDNYYNTHEVNGIILEFIGGEPFIEIDLIQKITDYFVNKSIKLNHRLLKYFMISVSTNGLLYFDEKVQNFI